MESAIDPQVVNDAVRAAFPGASGGECVELGRDFAVGRLAIDGDRARPGGYVSGPTQFALADAVLWYLTFGVLGRIELMAMTSDADITYLRPAHGSMLWARADLLSAGSRKVVGSVRVWCDDRVEQPSAVVKGTYVLPAVLPAST